MKFSVATVLALATAVFAQPRLTNSAFDVEEGKPFEITWDGAQGPVTITLKNGPEGHLNTVKVLKSKQFPVQDMRLFLKLSANITKAGLTGDSYTWTPEDLPSGTYAFQIDDTSGTPNYSKQFPYTGTGAALSSSGTVSSSAVSSTTSATSGTSSSNSTITSSASESTGSSTISK